jgi:ABC-type transport system involved in cytochrome c biogenesis permease subunit
MMMTYNTIFYYISIFFYAVSSLLFIVYAIKKEDHFFDLTKQWFGIAAVSGLFSIILRYRESGHLPMVTLFEITFIFAWTTSVIYFFLAKEKTPFFVKIAALSLIDILLLWNVFMDKAIYPLNPLLDSFWLGIHVPAAMLSYGSFVLSFVLSLYVLLAIKTGWKTWSLPVVNAQLIRVGVFLLGFCIITGAIWAKSAWGNYWSWDPKETWALITFLIYGGSIVVNKVFHMDHKWQASISVVGFGAMVFTFYGVSLLLVGHHAYQ